MRLQNLHAGKQHAELRGDHLLQHTKSIRLGRPRLVAAFALALTGTSCGSESGTFTRAKCSLPMRSRIETARFS